MGGRANEGTEKQMNLEKDSRQALNPEKNSGQAFNPEKDSGQAFNAQLSRGKGGKRGDGKWGGRLFYAETVTLALGEHRIYGDLDVRNRRRKRSVPQNRTRRGAAPDNA